MAPGVTQQTWTFVEGQGRPGAPGGPILRGKVGDLFTVTLVNDGEIGHSIDFHASKVAWNDEMRTIQPGESLVYEFTADYAGAFMYHCGTAPALHHIGNGMYGAIIIDPPNLAPVDHEYVIVQSELYLGPQGQPGDLTQDDERGLGRRGVQRLLATSTSSSPIRVEADERDPGVGRRRRPLGELGVPHRRHDLRHRLQGGHLPAAARRQPGRLAGARPAAGPGRVRRVQLRRGRASTRS